MNPSIKNGRVVLNFDWPGASTRHGGPIWATMGGAFADLVRTAEAASAKLDELAADPHLTIEGRRAGFVTWFKANAVAPLAKARDAFAAADAEIAATREKMVGAEIDRTDLAGALVRQEIRGWLRSLEPAARNARILTGLAKEEIAAIIEAPAALTGVTADQKAKIEADHVTSRHPAETARIAAVDEAKTALATAERAAVLAITASGSGITTETVAQALGKPSLAAKLAAMFGGDGGGDDGEAGEGGDVGAAA